MDCDGLPGSSIILNLTPNLNADNLGTAEHYIAESAMYQEL